MMSLEMLSNFVKAIENDEPFSLIDVKLYLTKRCNQRCIMCSNWTRKWRKTEELSTDEIISILKELKSLGLKHVTLFGGEPTLREDLAEIIKTCSKLKVKTELITNGSLITRELAFEYVESGLSEILFSWDSPYPDIHDYIRGVKGSFNRLINAIKYINDAREEIKSNIITITHTVMLKINYKEYPQLMALAFSLGIDEVAFSPMCPVSFNIPQDHPFHPRQIGLSRGDILYYNSSVAPQILEKAKKYGFPLNEEKVYIYGITEEEIKDSCNFEYSKRYIFKSYCFMPWYHMAIMHDGTILPCNKLKNMPLGNIKYDSIRDVWFSDTYRNIRRKCKALNSYKFLGCNRCSIHIARRHHRIMKILYDPYERKEYVKEGVYELFPRYIRGIRFRLRQRDLDGGKIGR